MPNEFEVTFDIQENDNIDVDYQLDEGESLDCLFKIDATTFEYTELANKPQINGVTLVGNKSSEQLYLQPLGDYATNDTVIEIRDALQDNIDAVSQEVSQEASDREDADEALQEQITANTNNFANYRTASNQDIIDLGLSNRITANTNNFANYRTSANQDVIDTTINNNITAINNKIPEQASSTNQLADKNFVNSSIASETANFVGTFNSLEELQAVENPTNNDYGFVKSTDTVGNQVFNRYKYNETQHQWLYEYSLNNSSFTANQWNAINSGATAEIISSISNKADRTDIKDGTLTIQANGVNVATFTANQSTDVTANISIPDSATWGNITGTLSNQTDLQNALDGKQPTGDYALSSDIPTDNSQLTNGAGYITSSYHDNTKYDASNPNGYQTSSQVNDAISTHNTSNIAHEDIRETIRDIQLFKFPNANIIGEPLINNGNVSRFSATNYMTFPFVVDVRDKAFYIEFCYTTTNDVTTQQNIIDSYFGLAIAIQNGKWIVAASSTGSSWDIGLATGTHTLSPNTTYHVKAGWDLTNYYLDFAIEAEEYTRDITTPSTAGLYPTTIYIGGSPNIFGAGSAHPALGTINMNHCYLYISGLLVWQGMDDAGLATRADVSLSNLDSVGQAKITYTAGTGIDITNNVISSTQTSAEWGNIQGTLSDQTDLKNALDSKQATGNYVTTDTAQTIIGEKTFNNSVTVDLGSTHGASLKVKGTGNDQAFLLERTGGAECVLEAGNSIGLFGTKTNHPIQIRTAYTNRMTIGTDGSVTLATAPASTSNNNQVATTKWVNDKGFITTSYHDSTKQNTLVSGTNIKTINSTSILGSGDIEIKSAPDLDNVTISKNSNEELQAIGVIDGKTNNADKFVTLTKAEYDSLETKDSNTFYSITDDTDVTLNLLETIYPVGSLYITFNDTCPLAALFGTWQIVGTDKVLQGAGSRGSVGTTLSESLPNIKGNTTGKVGSNARIGGDTFDFTTTDGAFTTTSWVSSMNGGSAYTSIFFQGTFDASRSSSTYQDNAPVQQDAILVNFFRRIA